MKIWYSAEYLVKIKNSGSSSNELKFQNSVSGYGSTESKYQNSVFCSGSTEFKSQNSVSGSSWKNLNSFVPYTHPPGTIDIQHYFKEVSGILRSYFKTT